MEQEFDVDEAVATEQEFEVGVFTSIKEVDEAIAALRKQRKELKMKADLAERDVAKAAKEEALAEAMASLEGDGLEEGDEISAILKGEEVAGKFVKQTAARFIVLVDGEKKTLPFDKYLGRAGAGEVSVATDEVADEEVAV